MVSHRQRSQVNVTTEAEIREKGPTSQEMMACGEKLARKDMENILP